MSRINTNVPSLIAQHNLQRSQNDLNVSLQRLSTGLAINRGADDPAGLIISERLRAEVKSIEQAIDNAERASNVIATGEAALQEVNALLLSMKQLIIESANTGALSKEERDANQLQIDSAIESINRIANTTSFAGLKLLNGSLDYDLTGVSAANIADVKIFNANFGTRSSIPVSVEVLNSAERAGLILSAGAIDFTGVADTQITIEGTKGVQTFQITSAMTMSGLAVAIAALSDATGVSATLYNPANALSGIQLISTEYGSDAFISVLGGFDPSVGFDFGDVGGGAGTSTYTDTGEDVLAIVNGMLALGDGLKTSVRSASLNLEMTLTEAFATATGGTPETFTIAGGGALYQVGPSVNSQQQVSIGIQSVSPSLLGNNTLGYLATLMTGGANALNTGNFTQAGLVLDESIDQITTLRGRLGAFERNTLDTSVRSQQIALENLTASESQLRDTDFAAETSRLTRAQILTSAGTSTLALANSSAQQVLALLQ